MLEQSFDWNKRQNKGGYFQIKVGIYIINIIIDWNILNIRAIAVENGFFWMEFFIFIFLDFLFDEGTNWLN